MSVFLQIGQKSARPFLTALGCCLSTTLAAQVPSRGGTSLIINGVIADSVSQTGLGYVGVELKQETNSQLVNRIISKEDGSFALQVPPGKPYTLRLTHVGYRAKIIQLPATPSLGLNLGIIALAATATQLQEVQVVASKPLVEQDLDKIIYHVEDDPESMSLSALDMLRKVPLLTVDADDRLQLGGQSSFQVLVNGKSSALFAHNASEVFRNLPASTIKRIEVLTNPPARYDAEGAGGVLNIITLQKSLAGYSGSVTAGGTSPKGTSLSAYTTAQAGKFSLAANLSRSTQTSPISHRSSFREDALQRSRLEQTGESTNSSRAGYLSGELGYQLDSLNQLSASYNLSLSSAANASMQQTRLLNAAGALTQAYRNLSTGQSRAHGSEVGLDYQRSFRNSDARLLTLSYRQSLGADFSATALALQPLVHYQGQLSTSADEDNTREHNFQADYVQPIGQQLLEAGLKATDQQNSSDYAYETQQVETGAFLPDPLLSNTFHYRQGIYAAYSSLTLKKDNWGLNVGLRLEKTSTDAYFQSEGTVARQAYANLIPSVSLAYKLPGASTLGLSYTQRIQRPGLSFLNPYVNRTDPRNISYGNPELVPAISHAFNLALTTFVKSSSLSASLFHNFTTSAIQQFTALGPDSIARTTYGNSGQNQTSGVALSGNTILFKKLSLSLNTTATYVRLTSRLEGPPRVASGASFTTLGSASYRLGHHWRASGTISYTSSAVQVQGHSAGYVWHTVSVNKAILKNEKVQIALQVSSPFQTFRRSFNEVNALTFHQQQESYVLSRRFTMSLSYRFGKVQGRAH